MRPSYHTKAQLWGLEREEMVTSGFESNLFIICRSVRLTCTLTDIHFSCTTREMYRVPMIPVLSGNWASLLNTLWLTDENSSLDCPVNRVLMYERVIPIVISTATCGVEYGIHPREWLTSENAISLSSSYTRKAKMTRVLNTL